MPRFSIIVPVYNVEKYLNKSLQSVLVQSFKDFEAIIIDDGSTDNCGVLCDQYADIDSRFLVIHTENFGLSMARNCGINKAQGDYIVLLDADDFLDIAALENLQRLLEQKNYDLIVNRAGRFDENTGVFFECPYIFESKLFENKSSVKFYENLLGLKNFTFTAWIFVIKKDFLIDNLLFFEPGILHEDELWTPYIILKAQNITFNNSNFYNYRINQENSIMSRLNIKKEFSLNFIIEKIIKDINEKKFEENEKKILLYRCADIYLTLIYNLNYYRKDKMYKELINVIAGKHKILLFQNTKRNRIVEKIISLFGIRFFTILTDIIRKMKLAFK